MKIKQLTFAVLATCAAMSAMAQLSDGSSRTVQPGESGSLTKPAVNVQGNINARGTVNGTITQVGGGAGNFLNGVANPRIGGNGNHIDGGQAARVGGVGGD